MSRRTDRSPALDGSVREILVDGPWRHREITANGIRFHLATGSAFSRERPLVLLLHGFGEFWWAWRHQLPALDAAGLSVAAVDLRGYGATDKTPRGYRQSVTGADISGVIRSLGYETATVVGHDWGGIAAWSTYAYAPDQVTALAVIGAPHPLQFPWRSMGPSLAWFQLPILPERVIMARQGAYVEWLLASTDRRRHQLPDGHGGPALPRGPAALAEPALCPGVPADVRPRPAAHRRTRLSTSSADPRRRAGADGPRFIGSARAGGVDAAADSVPAPLASPRRDRRRRTPAPRGVPSRRLHRLDRLAHPLTTRRPPWIDHRPTGSGQTLANGETPSGQRRSRTPGRGRRSRRGCRAAARRRSGQAGQPTGSSSSPDDRFASTSSVASADVLVNAQSASCSGSSSANLPSTTVASVCRSSISLR